jgi:hypothetical protein
MADRDDGQPLIMNEPINPEGVPSLDKRGSDSTDLVGENGRPANEPSDNDAAYRLAEPEPPHTQPNQPTAPAVESAIPEPKIETTFQPSAEAPEQAATEPFPDPAPEVRDVWTRWSDWKWPLIWTAAGVGLATLIVFGREYVAVLSFVAALTYGSYRVITSLEVPVRVTPQQAIEEFFAAAGHRLPNFDRMYALLTADGKQCDEFRNPPEFRAYWSERIAKLTPSPIWIVPLEFHVEGFTCHYNQDKSMATVRYTIRVAPRTSQASVRSVAELTASNLVVKGPDGQWYVNDGRLPDLPE